MTRVQFEGHTLDARTRDMIVALRVICDAPVRISQGCYNAGGVAASAGTHDGGGAADIGAGDLNDRQREEVVTKARKVGFAAWVRNPTQGNWGWHVHCIAIGCPDLSSGARSQVTAYKNGRNGLKNNGPDTFTRAYVDWTWERYAKTYPDLLVEDEVQQADIDKIADAVKAELAPVTQAYSAFNAKNLEQQLRTLYTNLDALNQKYAVAVNNYTAQLDAANDTDVAKLASAVGTLTAKVDALTTKVDALPK